MKKIARLLTIAAGAVLIAGASVTASAADWHEAASDTKLSAVEHAYYNVLLNKCRQVSESGGDTSFDFDFGAYGVGEEQFEAIHNKAVTLLEANHPEYLCWATDNASLQSTTTGDTTTYRVGLVADRHYQSSDDDYVVDSASLSPINTAISNANALISENADKSDYEKIKAYADYISANNTYNTDAARNTDNYTSQDDYSPWKFTYVFDNDPSTNVICEGYAKAFQYLMDHSTFSDSTIRCKTVTGSGNGEDHMWNIVTIGNSNYLTDITWYDQPSYTEGRYLLGTDDGAHVYDSDTTGIYTDSELAISPTAYEAPVPKKKVTVTIADKTITEGDAIPEFTATTDVALDDGASVQDLVDISCQATSSSKAGTYPITGTAKSSASGYDIAIKNGTLTIKAKPEENPETTPEVKKKQDILIRSTPTVTGTYGDRLSAFKISGGNVTDQKGQAVEGSWKVSSDAVMNKANAGKVISLIFTPRDQTSYNGDTVMVTPTVNKRKIEITIDDIERSVGERRPFSFKITSGTLAEGDTENDLGISLTSNDTADTVGTYRITGTSSSEWYNVTVRGGTLKIKAKEAVRTYYITYTFNGGDGFGNPTSYTEETDTFTLINPTRQSYVFTGWTGSNGTTPQMEVTIPKGTKGNLFYTANWRLAVNNSGNSANNDNNNSSPYGGGIEYISDNSGNASSDTASSASSAAFTAKQSAQIASVEKKNGSVKKLTAAKNSITVKYSKKTVSGKTVKYQVAIKKAGSKNWTKSFVAGTSKTFKNLKRKTTYWVSVRPYIVVNNTRYFGKWSKTKSKKTK